MVLHHLISLFFLLPALQYDYDVFLSFRGGDTRFSFADHLHSALIKEQIRTFRDDGSIPDGENIEREIKRAIYRSRSSIVVLSKDFANSSWCLDELVMFMYRREPFGYIVLPVFYYVDPSEVGDQTGGYGKAFDEHEKMNKGKMDRVEKWRKALKQVAQLKGLVYPDGRGEREFIQDVVKKIQRKLKPPVPPIWRPLYLFIAAVTILVWWRFRFRR